MHSSCQRIQFMSCLFTLLQFALQTTEDDVERKTCFTRRPHASHPAKTLLSELGSSLNRKRGIRTSRARLTLGNAGCSVDSAGTRMSHRSLTANRRCRSSGMCLLHVLLLLMLLLVLVRLRTSGNLSILFREDADDSSGYFVVDDCFVVFADNIDTKFLY